MTVTASLYPLAHPSDFLPERVSLIQPTAESGSQEPGVYYDLQRWINHHLCAQKISGCLLPVRFLFLLLSYHFRMYFPRSFQESPIITWGFACQWMSSSLTAFSNTSGPLFLIQHLQAQSQLFHSVVAFCESCLALIPPPPGASGCTRCPKDQRCIFLAQSHYIKRQNPKLYLRKRERETLSGPAGNLKRALNFPAIECKSLPKVRF